MRPLSLLIPYVAALVGLIVLADQGALPPWAMAVYGLPGGDLAAHLGLAGGLSLLAERASGRALVVVGRLRLPLGSGLAGLALGAEELSQIAIPARVFSPLDLAATLCGVVLGWVLARALQRRKNQRTVRARSTG